MDATSRLPRPAAVGSRLASWRLVFGLLIAAVLSAGLGGIATAVPATQDEVVDYTGAGATVLGAPSVNVRDCPDFDCETVGTLVVNERVTIDGPEEDGFLPVTSAESGVSGYGYALYISVDGQPAPWFTEGEPGCNRIAMIFNIGVGAPFDYGVLDTLEEWDVPATFFGMGWTTLREPETIEAIAAGGHPIGTHGNDAIDLPTSSDALIVEDLQASIDIIQPVAGDNWVTLQTPFAQSSDERTRTIVGSQGILPVGWQIQTADYRPDIDPNEIWDRVVPNAYDGGIIEFHIDANNTANTTGVALPWIIDALLQRDYEFVTIPDMILPCGVTTADLAGGADATPVAAATPTDRSADSASTPVGQINRSAAG
ncbi:MAG TPA: polysaccharide deacetylase family protein [Thermomicrobiales bacterium]|jgi:peptidoglycan/xylan/chitin deacetylase (PgdA/CDA1 family)|nr:polysaccharide deacetylase family protein [Thermomicrobiales bacterium]